MFQGVPDQDSALHVLVLLFELPQTLLARHPEARNIEKINLIRASADGFIVESTESEAQTSLLSLLIPYSKELLLPPKKSRKAFITTLVFSGLAPSAGIIG